MNQVFPTYAEVVGLGLVAGGLMVSAASICDIFFNPIAGMTSDRFSPTRSMVLWTLITMVSFVILYLGSSSVTLSCIGAGINDAIFAEWGIQPSLCLYSGCATLKRYSRAWSALAA